MKIIFLDFDGVLNSNNLLDTADLHRPETSEELELLESLSITSSNARLAVRHIDPTMVSHLNTIIAATAANVIISTAWRKLFSMAELEGILKFHGFKGTIVDRTPITFGYRPRNLEIYSWFQSNTEEPLEVTNFVILDDLHIAGENYPDNFVNTDPDIGLTRDEAEKAIAILNG